jgi:hypothetical protein
MTCRKICQNLKTTGTAAMKYNSNNSQDSLLFFLALFAMPVGGVTHMDE